MMTSAAQGTRLTITLSRLSAVEVSRRIFAIKTSHGFTWGLKTSEQTGGSQESGTSLDNGLVQNERVNRFRVTATIQTSTYNLPPGTAAPSTTKQEARAKT